MSGNLPLRGSLLESQINSISLGELIHESSVRNLKREYSEVRSITNSQGLVRTSDLFDNVRTSADTRNYKVVNPGMFVYNPSRINVGSIAWLDETKPVIVSPMYVVFGIDSTRVSAEYLMLFLGSRSGKSQIEGKTEIGARFRLTYTSISQIRIPLPPIEMQRKIVRILGTFKELEFELETELEARRRQYEHYRSELLLVDTDTAFRPLGDLAENLDRRRKPVTRDARTAGSIPYYGASGIVDHVSDFIFDGDFLLVSEDGANLLARSTPIAFSISGKTWVNNHAHVLRFNTYAERRFVEIYLNSIDLSSYISGAAQPKLNQANLNQIPIPDPTLSEKERVVALLDKFDALVNDLSVGLPAELAARRKQYEYYRDRLLTFEEATA